MKNFKVISIILLQLFFVVGVLANNQEICGTQDALEAFKRGVKLPRPGNGPKYVYSTHFIIHFDTVGANITTRAYAESTSKYAEYSWAKQCDTLLWAEPPQDGSAGGDYRYDIYIVNQPAGILGVTYTEFIYSTPYPDGATSYIEVDNNISPLNDLRATVTHEFAHASQFRYSYLENAFWYENCATWMSDVCYDNVNFYVGYLSTTPNPLGSPNLAITTTTNLYEYAGALWPMFLQEYYNIACPRYAWERMGTISGENTLPGLDYAVTTYYASNLYNALKKYGVWRYFTGTRADVTYHFTESNLWPTSTLLATWGTYPVPTSNQGSMAPSGPGGADLIRFNPGSGTLTVNFDGQDGYNWGAYVVGYRVPAVSLEQEITLNANWAGSTIMPWSGNNHIALIPVVTQWTSSADNLTFTYSATQFSTDVGVIQMIAPTATIDSGTIVTPQARVKNYGISAANFPATFRIGTFYTNTQNVTNLAAGDSMIVSFALCTLRTRGTHTTRCTTALTGDQNASNNAMSGSVTIRVANVGVTQIVIPTGTVDSTSQIYPRAQVRNYGTSTETFNVTFRIFGTSYNQTRTKTLNSGIEDTVNFPGWVPVRGSYTTRCTTLLIGDVYKPNDTLSGSFTVRVQDVGVTQLLGPSGAIDSGSIVTPQARVKNFGTNTVTFPVTFRIGSFYTRTQTVNNLISGDSTLVSFAPCTLLLRGTHATKCTTLLTGDLNPTNNALSGSVTVTVQMVDVGVIQIVAPTGTIDSGTIITPQAKVRNYGNNPATFPVTFRIGSFYINTQPVNNLGSGDSATVNFALCTLRLRDTHVTRCTTALTGDQNTANDALSGSIFILACDVGVAQIIAPVGSVSIGATVTPSARISNYGVNLETFPVFFRIISPTDTVYSDDTIITIAADDDTIINFATWTVAAGSYRSFVRTVLAGDQISINDTASRNFSVSEIGWQQMANVPAAPSGKYPKNGTCITGLNGNVYLLKGNNTPDFLCFAPNSGLGSWTTLTAIPLGTKETGDGKNPKKGASITGFNDIVYALRGNNTPGFWRYATTGSPGWQKLNNIPTGAKNPKGGSRLTYARTASADCIFAMKGSKTAEFYLYSITGGAWQPTASPGTGTSGKLGYKEGSCLTYDGDSLVYVLKSNYGDFFRYNALSNTWTELRRLDPSAYLNRDGKKKKVKDGAGLVYVNGAIYLIKGGNTLEFWKYNIGSNNWSQMNPANIWDIPIGSGKKVKSGGSLCLLDNNFYAVKGNNTPEFYKHNPPITALTAEPTISEEVMEINNNLTIDNVILSIKPNPAENMVTISHNLPNTEPVSLKLYNISGSLVKSYYSNEPKNGLLQIDVRTLSQGVYILRLNSGETEITRKLVIEK